MRIADDTTLGAALKRAGVRPEIVAFDKAIRRLLDSGGTIADARERVELAAERMPGEGQTEGAAASGRSLPADARQPNGDGAGQSSSAAASGHGAPARPSPPDRGGAGHSGIADKAKDVLPAPREPSAAARRAMAKVANASADALIRKWGEWGTWTVPMGPALRDLRIRDGAGMLRRQMAEAGNHAITFVAIGVLQAEVDKLGVPDVEQTYFDVLGPKRIRELSQRLDRNTIRKASEDALVGVSSLIRSVTDGTGDAPHA